MKRWLTNHQRAAKPAAATISKAPNAMNSRLRSSFRRAAKSTVRSGFSRTKAEKPGPEIATSLMGRSCGLPNTWTGEVRRTDAVGQGPAGAESGRGHFPAAPAGRGEGAGK